MVQDNEVQLLTVGKLREQLAHIPADYVVATLDDDIMIYEYAEDTDDIDEDTVHYIPTFEEVEEARYYR